MTPVRLKPAASSSMKHNNCLCCVNAKEGLRYDFNDKGEQNSIHNSIGPPASRSAIRLLLMGVDSGRRYCNAAMTPSQTCQSQRCESNRAVKLTYSRSIAKVRKRTKIRNRYNQAQVSYAKYALVKQVEKIRKRNVHKQRRPR